MHAGNRPQKISIGCAAQAFAAVGRDHGSGDRVAASSGRIVAFRDGVALPPGERPDVAVRTAG